LVYPRYQVLQTVCHIRRHTLYVFYLSPFSYPLGYGIQYTLGIWGLKYYPLGDLYRIGALQLIQNLVSGTILVQVEHLTQPAGISSSGSELVDGNSYRTDIAFSSILFDDVCAELHVLNLVLNKTFEDLDHVNHPANGVTPGSDGDHSPMGSHACDTGRDVRHDGFLANKNNVVSQQLVPYSERLLRCQDPWQVVWCL